MGMNVSVHMSLPLDYFTVFGIQVMFWNLKIDNLLEAFRYRNAIFVLYGLEAVVEYRVKHLLLFRQFFFSFISFYLNKRSWWRLHFFIPSFIPPWISVSLSLSYYRFFFVLLAPILIISNYVSYVLLAKLQYVIQPFYKIYKMRYFVLPFIMSTCLFNYLSFSPFLILSFIH